MRNKDCQKLRKCPFCGGEAEVEIVSLASWDEFVPHCKNPKCVAFYLGYIDEGLYKTEAEAIEAWNRRVEAE